jgi:hypothetical protein
MKAHSDAYEGGNMKIRVACLLAALLMSVNLAMAGNKDQKGEHESEDHHIAAVPEPSSWVLVSVVILGVGAYKYRQHLNRPVSNPAQ